MDELLTPVSTTYLKPNKVVAEVNKAVETAARSSQISSVDEALDALRNQPDYDSLLLVLRYLTTDTQPSGNFHLQVPGPKSAAVVHLLVSEIAPNYWTLLREGSADEEINRHSHQQPRDAALLIQCLQSVAGLNAVLAHLKALIQEHKLGGKESKRPDLALNLGIFLDLLASLLEGNGAIRTIWVASTAKLATAVLKKTQSQTLLSLLTSGRIPSMAAEALALAGRDAVPTDARWAADGLEFSRWIGQNIVSWAKLLPKESELHFCSDIFQRGMSLGYSETLVKGVIDGLLLQKGVDTNVFVRVCFHQPQGSKKTLNILLQHLSQHLNGLNPDDSASNATVHAAAGIIYAVANGNETVKNHLISWCATSSGAGLGDGIGIRRAVLAVLAKDKDSIAAVLERSLSQFGDQLYIRHAAILQQNVHAEILLLSAGYISRLSPIKLRMIIRSSPYLSAISNRIAATQPRARFLGMVVGESLSALIDDKSQKLDFHMEETDTEEARWLKSLVNVSDEVGPIEPILKTTDSTPVTKPLSKTSQKAAPIAKPKPKPKPEVKTPKPKGMIQVIDPSDDEEDEDEDDLVPYAKDPDPEDSDDDATLVQRNKLKAPVYIRDLIAFLRDTESYDKQKLALQTAPLLIRRKANFGMEVSSHADELAGLLVGLQDKFDIENFVDLKLQGMVALIVAQPKAMAPWFSRTFFEGDYSLSQRSQALVAVGLSAREIAGFDASEYQSAASFPSKRLPEKMEQLYLDSSSSRQDGSSAPSRLKPLPPTALDTISQSITSSFLAPMAASAADATTGPDALKLQTFTARYKSKSGARPRVRAIPNTTAALVAGSFFSPLTAHFQLALRSAKPLVLSPALLALYLQTLGVVVHAAGPSTLSLPQLTAELWGLLLAVRVHARDDLGALKGWLVAVAALLEVNDGDMRRLCETQGREVVETREWVGDVFNKTRGEDGGEENEVKMLAAGVLIKLSEAIEKYQALLMGDLVGFS